MGLRKATKIKFWVFQITEKTNHNRFHGQVGSSGSVGQVPTAPVIMVTALDSAKSAVRAMKTGAFDYITKPFGVDDIRLVVERALSAHQFMREVSCLSAESDTASAFEGIIGQSAVHEGDFPLHQADRGHKGHGAHFR